MDRRTAEQTRRQLLDAARTVTAELGPHRATVRAIAAAADMQPSLINRHFGSVSNLMLLVRLEVLAGWAQAIEASEPDEVWNVALTYLCEHPAELTALALTTDTTNETPSRFPVADVIEAKLAHQGVERSTVSIATALMAGWAAAESRFVSIGFDDIASGRAGVLRAIQTLVRDRATHH